MAQPLKPTKMMVFPSSRRPQTRRLVLRNPTDQEFIIKVSTSCPEAINIDTPYLKLGVEEWNSTYITLDASAVPEPADLEFHTVIIYCRLYKQLGAKGAKQWCKASAKDKRIHCAYRLKIARSDGFASADTVVDLPGRAGLVETPNFLTIGCDDRDTRTARGCESETATAEQISRTDLLAVVPDSQADTARNIDEGTKTARWINPAGCYVADLFEKVIPGSSAYITTNAAIPACFPCGQQA